jgi:hypothetical protein
MVFKTGNTVLLVALAALALAPGASAWAWPVDGPVLRPFVSEGDPYAGGQHRGIDLGAPTGSDVRSATDGVVAYAGQLPHQGLCLTIRTEDGWSVTLVHLGSIGVSVGTPVSEGDVVGTIGPSGEPEGTEPYVHLGIRHTAEANGYVDPLMLLPPRQAPEQPPPAQQLQQPQQQTPAPAPAPPVPVSRSASPRPTAHPDRHRGSSHRHAVHRSRAKPLRTAAPTHPDHATRLGPPRRQRAARAPVPGRPAPKRVRHRLPVVPRAPVPEHPNVGRVAPARRGSPAVSRGTRMIVRARPDRSRRAPLIALALPGVALLAIGVFGLRRRLVAAQSTQPSLRKMSTTEPAPEERLPEPSTTAHSRRRRVALREWPTASGARRRLRCSVGHHRSISPAAGRPSPDGQRHRRARNSGHGRGRSRRTFAA